MASSTLARRLGLTGNRGCKAPVRAATTANITLSGEQTIGGVAVVDGDRVLVWVQTDTTQNGVYDVSTGSWTRSIDANGTQDWSTGTIGVVTSGTYANQLWILTTAGLIIPGISSLVFQIGVPSLAVLALSSGAGLVGFNYAVVYSAGTVGMWLQDLALGAGATFIGFIQAGAGAVLRTIQERLRLEIYASDYMSAAQKADVAARTALIDVTDAIASAVTRAIAIGGKRVILPEGICLLNGGVASPDGYKNGVLLPDTNGDFTTNNGIVLVGSGTGTTLKAGSTSMVVLRHSRLYSGAENIKIDGGSLANVIGRIIGPEDMTQTSELVSQSYACYRDTTIENCVEGTILMPGPTVLGADSGCFYHKFYSCIYNNNLRDIWMKKDVTGNGNRTTRTSFYSPVFTRGNTGIQIDGGTEIDFYSPNFEMKNAGVTPSAVPTAFYYNDTNPANIRIFCGYAEACTKALVAVSTAAANQIQVLGFVHNSVPDASEANMQVMSTATFSIPAIAKTFRGSLGNVELSANGAGISFSRVGSSSISTPVGGDLVFSADAYSFNTAAGTAITTISATEFIPRVDNATAFGINGLRWSVIWAANGTIQTSDARTKKDIIDAPLGLEFILALRPVAYRFKVGGNKIVGRRVAKPAVLNENGDEIEVEKYEAVLEPIPGKRQHFGFLTKNVKAAAGDVDFGGFIKTDQNDPESEEALRYDEFLSPLVRAVQELTARMMVLEVASKKKS